MQLSALSVVVSFAAPHLSPPSTVAPSVVVQPGVGAAARADQLSALASQHATIFPSTTTHLAYIGQEPTDVASRAAAMRSAAAKEEAMKAARAQKALERAQAAKEGKERLAQPTLRSRA